MHNDLIVGSSCVFRYVLSRYMEFEARFGDLGSILKIDKRMGMSPQVWDGF